MLARNSFLASKRVSTVAFDRIGLLSLFKVEHLSNYTGEIMSLKLSCFLLGLQL